MLPAHHSVAPDAPSRLEAPPQGTPPATEPGARSPAAALNYVHACSQFLVAVLRLPTWQVDYVNVALGELLGVATDTDRALSLADLFDESNRQALQQLYRRHVLDCLLQARGDLEIQGCRWLHEPVVLTVRSPRYAKPRYVACWLRSRQLQITPRQSAALGWAQMAADALAAVLAAPRQVEQLAQDLRLEDYDVQGPVVLEAVDATEQETARRITQLLIDGDSVLQPAKFQAVNQQLRSLFDAQNTVIISIEAEQARLFSGAVSDEMDAQTFALEKLHGTHLMQAIEAQQVIAIADLAANGQHPYAQRLLTQGVRSLLWIPLVARSESLPLTANHPPQVIGLVGLLSDRADNFNALDCRYAEQLIPAFTTALATAQRQLVQRRFINNIHPSVEWRFLQEAERRSLGLPAEPIVFTDVFPLYGISDIRGSSDERNRAIQADLLAQFHLGLAVLEAVQVHQDHALVHQLRLDLQEMIGQIEQGVTVDAEVSLVRYLQENLEAHFAEFAAAGEGAIAAIQTYRAACDNPHQCLYEARAVYDEMVGQINTRLRANWDRWQAQMQQVTPHYCDIEATDGIDHMIYAGSSIDPNFTPFRLKSLRYEQLRAMCDAARTAFALQAEYGTRLQVTHLVLVQECTVDIFHDESTERLFDVRGTRDTRYEIVKKRIDKALDEDSQSRITQPGQLTVVYSTDEEWQEYRQYLRYLEREGWIEGAIAQGLVQPLQGVNGLKYARVAVRSAGDGRVVDG